MPVGLRQPPDGVETTPTSGETLPLREAARRLRLDHRTVQARIVNGTLRGGAIPQPQRLQWYVYADQVPTSGEVATSDDSVAAAVSSDIQRRLDNQASQIVALKHNNQLLSAAVGDLLEALDQYKSGARHALAAAQSFEQSAEGFAASLNGHREVLAQLMTPDDLENLPL